MARQPPLGFQSLPGPRSTQVCKSSPVASKNPLAPLPSLVVLGNAQGTCLVWDLFAAEPVNRTVRNQFEWTEEAAVRHPCSCDYCTAAFDVVISCTALPVSLSPRLFRFPASSTSTQFSAPVRIGGECGSPLVCGGHNML
jgi:hypothetical protein